MADTKEKILYGVDTTFEAVAKKATPKFKTTPGRLLFAGFMAGAFIAFGFLLAVVAAAGYSPKLFPDTGNISAFKILLGAVFPVGLIAVILAGADLWTGNVQFLSSAKAKGYADFKCVLYNWFGSYGGNFIGSIFLALLVVPLTGLFGHVGDPNTFGQVTVGIATGKVSKDILALFFLGIGCNWLVNVAIWQSARVQDGAGKILAIWFPIFAFVAIGFEHAIANMWAIPAGILLSDYAITWTQFFHNIIPVTFGNAIGGFLFVAFYYWYLSHPELTTDRLIKEIIDFLIVFIAFWAVAALVPAGIGIALDQALGKGAMYLVPLVLSAYYIVGAFVLYKKARPA
ncbi:formate/nitrite transporter family protein [Thermococcus sp. GR6]|uniref:formate/nitrite transporter family protein n=1 Tax=Thermococcus sp. GR6 TaxID=1638256 RepID=UPI0014300361|nr:formate/nitrite transporter family protein [Thermococcus sp. GR6]NJE43165.1 formate/nitrite transporter family protein [Thermococcus sp. GR6]